MNAILGWKLAQDREAQGLTQERVAQAVQVSQSAWSRVERGEIPLSAQDLFVVAPLLSTTAAAIADFVDRVAQQLVAQGVDVRAERLPRQGGGGAPAWAFLAGAALTAVVLAGLTVKK